MEDRPFQSHTNENLIMEALARLLMLAYHNSPANTRLRTASIIHELKLRAGDSLREGE
jgi:hypothetical protein